MMVQAMIIFYILPTVISTSFNIDIDVVNEVFSIELAAFVTVTLNTAAYLTEVLRGGIESLNKGQMEAARSLGMSRSKSMLFVVLPQAIKNSLPSICNEFIINIKDTSVLNVIQVMDLFYIVGYINGKTFSNDGIYVAAIIYLCLTLGISKLLGFIEKKMNLVNKPLPSSN
jgi:putative lysine transport system permease protein